MNKNLAFKSLLTWPAATGLLVFVFFSILGTLATWQEYRIFRENQNSEINFRITQAEDRIQQILKQSYHTLLTLALIVDQSSPEPDPEEFNSLAEQLLESNAFLDAVELVPGGVIKYIYPLQGNESAMGYDILQDPARNKEALKAIRNKGVYFAGPLELKQGGMAIIGRLPVYLQNEFWGFSAVIIKLSTLLEFAGIAGAGDPEYQYQFSKVNPATEEEEHFIETGEISPKTHVKYFTFPEGDWRLSVSAKSAGPPPSVYLIAAFSLALSVLSGLMITFILKRPRQLKKLVMHQADKLVASEQKFRALFEQASDGIVHFNENGDFLDVNSSFCELLGYTRAEIKRLRLWDIVEKHDLMNSPPRHHQLRSGEHVVFERKFLHKDGSVVDVEISAKMIQDGNFQSIVRSIAERKRHAEILKEVELSYLKALEEEKEKFGKELHDGLGQILAAITLYNNFLLEEGSPQTGEISSKIKELVRQATAEVRVISHGLMSDTLRKKGLCNSIQEMCDHFNSFHDIRFQLSTENFEEDLIDELIQLNLYRITQEITTNIIRHSRASKASIELKLENKILKAYFSDDGQGMKQTGSLAKGTGIRNISKRVRFLKGNIEMDSSPGRGTRFSIYIPLDL